MTQNRKMREWPVGSGARYPVFDADSPLTIDLSEEDRCSGIQHDPTRCAISTTLRDKLDAVAVQTGYTFMWVLRLAESGPFKGQLAWERRQTPAAARRALQQFDATGRLDRQVTFAVVKPSERLGVGKRRKTDRARARKVPSYQPGYVSKGGPSGRRRSLCGLVHTTEEKP